MENNLGVIYNKTNELIIMLEKFAFIKEKDLLKDALSYGNSFGEILSNIGVELKKIVENKNSYPSDIVNVAINILKKIDNFEV